MKRRTHILSSLVIIGAMLVMSMPLYAQDAVTGEATQSDASNNSRLDLAREQLRERSEEVRQQKKDLIDETRKVRVIANCEKALVKVTSYEARVAKYKEGHTGVYFRFIERLDSLVERLTGSDIDGSQLASDVEELKGKVVQFKLDFSTLEVLLAAAIETDCAEVEAQELYDYISDIRSSHTVFKQEIKEIKTFIKEVIRADIVAIKTSAGEE